MSGIVVVKLGGSLMRSDAAARLLEQWPRSPGARRIVVPGGGIFADAVRAAQAERGFTDVTAHRLALMAMEMSARVLTDSTPGFVCASGLPEFVDAWNRSLTPVWTPMALAADAPDIAQTWDVTSDTLAAWLAARVDATRLVVVKSCVVPDGIGQDAAGLAAAGIVDPSFPRYVAGRTFRWSIATGVDGALDQLR